MRFSSVIFALVVTLGAAQAEDPVVDDILKKSKEIIEEDGFTESEAATLRQRGANADEDWSWLEPKSQADVYKSSSESAQQRSWAEIERRTLDGEPSIGPKHAEPPADVMYVFVSLSMDDAAIRELFLQALEGEEKYRTIFVLRGWTPPDINGVVSKLNALFPDKDKLGELPNVQINPNLFKSQAIDVVPTYVAKNESGRWRKVIGLTSLSNARKTIDDGRYQGEAIGPVRGIAEPDVLALIQKRIAETDWNAQVEKAKEGLLTKARSGRELPRARKSESYLVDLTIVMNQSLAGTTGETFVERGETINPFDYVSTQKRFVFFDANDEEQVQQAIRWKGEHRYTVMISTIPPRNSDQRLDVISRLGQPVFEMNELLASRFKIRAVPAIAYQEGKMLRVDVAGRDQRLIAQKSN